jgi:peptide-methionine (S)-S-oxide reductase
VLFNRHKLEVPTEDQALAGRAEQWFTIADRHLVLDAPVVTDESNIPAGYEVAVFGLGCFWGAEEIFWQMPGVWSTSVGYTGGSTPHPSYDQVCSGQTGHLEAVRVVFDPAKVSYADLVKKFFTIHDPTQGMRQGNDVGTQYRSAVYYASDEQKAAIEASRERFQASLTAAGLGEITTEIAPAGTFYYAESYHQQYLDKNPNGYCGLGGTGVSCPVGVGAKTV